MSFNPFSETDQPTMANFNQKFQDAIAQATQDALSAAPKIAVGSYVGTGTYGSSNPNTLTFGFKPKIVLIFPNCIGNLNVGFLAVLNQTASFSYWNPDGSGWFSPTLHATFSETGVSWYADDIYDYQTLRQMNDCPSEFNLVSEYHYIAIG